MSFDVPADAYDRFMGRFSEPLAARFADACGVQPGARVLDVGCGTGALTAVLVDRLGAEGVRAVEPSPAFVEAVRRRLPGADVRAGTAEELPFPAASVDAALAQLVVHFMADPVRGLREMARVTRPGGIVAACVWDHAGDGGPLSTFWEAVHDVSPGAPDESHLAGARAGHLAELLVEAGLADVESSSLTVDVPFASFDDWWEPFTLGVGPAGAHVAGLDAAARDVLRDRCARLLPTGPFEVRATAWCARGRVAVTADAQLHAVCEAFAEVPGVVLPGAGRRHFGTATLRVHGRIAAFTPGDHLVVKLPAARVAALIASGEGLAFPDGRPPMREWVAIVSDDPGVWHERVAESLAHVGG